MKWADIPGGIQLLVIVVPALFAAVGWMYLTFETANAAQQKWVQHNQAIACKAVYDLQAQIRVYIERLKLDRSLTQTDRDWIDAEIKRLHNQIKHIDPNGVCG
jgi:hypothetical protein